jgi:hypothetical protein
MPEAEHSLPSFHYFESFCVMRAEGLRRLLTIAPVETDSFDFFRLRTYDFSAPNGSCM